jgi:hypothetical protein
MEKFNIYVTTNLFLFRRLSKFWKNVVEKYSSRHKHKYKDKYLIYFNFAKQK